MRVNLPLCSLRPNLQVSQAPYAKAGSITMPDNLPLHSCEIEEENSGVQPGSDGGLCGGTETSWQASCVRDKREMTFLMDLEPQTQQWDRAIWSTLPKDALFQSQPPGLSFSPPAFFSYALYLSLIAINVTIPLKPFRGLHFLSFFLSFFWKNL